MANRFPDWIRRPWAEGQGVAFTRDLIDDLGLCTVCQSARCPNRSECWEQRTATFMILGDVCTRNCRFCSVLHGCPEAVDPGEPGRVAEAVRRMGLKHAVVTSVTRGDLRDGGAGAFAATIHAIRAEGPGTTTEVLTPDFGGDGAAIVTVLDAEPDVFGHNIETVRRLYSGLRGNAASYDRGLEVLRVAAARGGPAVIKSALMVGHGESREEVLETLSDLRAVGCEAVCIGQYLRPTAEQEAVVEFVTPERFGEYEAAARAMGFGFVASGPFVRSSYRSAEVLGLRLSRAHDNEGDASEEGRVQEIEAVSVAHAGGNAV